MPTYVCPTCGRETSVANREDARFRPFCCKRCQLIDLHHWFEGDYCVSDPLLTDPDAADQDDSPPHDKSP